MTTFVKRFSSAFLMTNWQQSMADFRVNQSMDSHYAPDACHEELMASSIQAVQCNTVPCFCCKRSEHNFY